MLISVFGDPSHQSKFWLKAIQALTELSYGTYHWVCVGTAADLRTALAEASHKNIVFFADSPDRHISTVFLESEAPRVVVVHDPYDIADSLLLNRNLDTITSIRVTSQSLSCIHDLALSPSTYVISEHLDITNVQHNLTRLAEVYQIPVNNSILEKTTNRLMRNAHENDPARAGETTFPNPGYESAAMFKCLRGFEALLAEKAVNKIYWPRDVFMDPDKEGALLSGPLDLTGAARLILYGPFLHIPPGSWTATIVFEVRENLSGNVLKVDIYCDGVTGEWRFELPKEGTYSFDLPLKVFEPRHPVQIRFYVMQGAIEGIFDLKHVDLGRA